MDSLASPRILAVANNTQTDRPTPNRPYPRSTLASVAVVLFGQYGCFRAMIPKEGTQLPMSIGTLTFEQYAIASTSEEQCQSYRDPLKDVITDVNKSK